MNLKEELQAEKVSHMALTGFSQVASGTTVRETLAVMREQGHNVCLTLAEGELKGIFTDRDVLRKVAAHPENWDKAIDLFMTPDPVTVAPDYPAASALWLMDKNHFRNLPVVDEDGRITGILTHLAVINYLAAHYPIEILNLPPRPDQFPERPEGG
jgi:CBS domain-containing protein